MIKNLTSIATFDIPFLNLPDIFGNSNFYLIEQVFLDTEGRKDFIENLDRLGY